ncbi:hypothetical protein SAMN02927924_02872 [Sphingobium faniae]|uniref:hypothetical protein n=1 Tax=Sphingobium sp. YC-XJ3 TaxID=3024245 RepID=UPI000876D8A4|nr:hypothetical protein [Sphingobium sp. YC-XJ3]WDA38396.1 hypothetical protein PO876_09555 [Sphingobium sp. YC-XJ3]SCW79238.1 hypothetical protein SAMN02927924_02872 [Sphingobium faniae]
MTEWVSQGTKWSQRSVATADEADLPALDDRRFTKGCLIAVPLSPILWWLILRTASAMT